MYNSYLSWMHFTVTRIVHKTTGLTDLHPSHSKVLPQLSSVHIAKRRELRHTLRHPLLEITI